MPTFNELIKLQQKTGEDVQRIITNYKKDTAERKTSATYYKERLQRLNSTWDEFEERDTKLRAHMDQPMDHEYFTTQYDSIREVAQCFLELFSKEMKRLEASALEQDVQQPKGAINKEGAREKSAASLEVEKRASNIHHGLVRKIKARMTALRRLINTLSTGHEEEPAQFYNINNNTIQQLWKQLEELQDEAWDKLENPAEVGFDQAEFDQLGDMVRQQLVTLSVKADQLKKSNTPVPATLKSPAVLNTLPLPKVTIPQFNGDYLNWRQFFNLFTEMVDKQAVPLVQKMWYLKANVSGEAAKLISHFTLTEENYNAAWALLQDRYNNTRILVATLVQKLLDQPCGTSSAAAVKCLHDTTKECLLALNNLGVKADTWDPLLLQILIKKLDRGTHIRFEQSLENPKELQKISKFLSFLEMQFQSMEAIGQRERPTAQSTSRAVSSIISSDSSTCLVCNSGKHPLYFCRHFLQWSASERLNWIQKQQLCVNCFKKDHMAKNCTSRSCSMCDKKHNSLLHLGNKAQTSRPNQSTNRSSHFSQSSRPSQPSKSSGQSSRSNQAISSSQSSDQFSRSNQAISSANSSSAEVKATGSNAAVTSATTNTRSSRQDYVLLATAKIRITAANGRSDEFRAILDSGSQINIVSERLIKRLGITPSKTSLDIEGIGNGQKRATQRVNVKLQSLSCNYSTNLEAFVLPSIISAQPNQHFDVCTWPIPSNIKLADPDFHQQGKIDVLIGAEFYFNLMTIGKITLSNDLPVLQNTTFGWIISGKIGGTQNQDSSDALTCAVLGVGAEHNDMNASLDEVVERLWKMDEVETSGKTLSSAEKQCESHFAHNVRKNADGRFIVTLPFLENTSALGESRNTTYNRFLSLERRLLKNEEMRNQYIQFMEEYERLGHMKEVDIDSVMFPNYFIPHHCVLKPDSTTTKLRVVFDASAKTSSGQSLNDLMYKGPTVQSELFSILLRFRLPRFVFTTDIEKMYRQVLIHPDDQRYQIINWRKDPTTPVKYYQLNTVTYGTRAAPYLATKCLQRVADENINNYPLGAQFLQDNFYVDDGLGGSDNLTTVMEMQRQLIHILKKHGFNLRKWSANHPRLLHDIPHGDQEVNLDFSDNSIDSIQTLGLMWLPKTDQFCVKVKLNPVNVVTKRTVTSDLARLFDPLGILAPVIVKAKMFIQQLWLLKVTWDEALSAELTNIWEIFRTNLANLNNFQVSRHIFSGEVPLTTQLHVFADASERAYGAVAYIRATLKNGGVIVRLVCAKSRVAPLKKQTLPRLELCAAVLAAQLSARVRDDLQIKNQPTFLWTNSEIVLSWINAQSSSFQTFVANRIAAIQTSTSPEQWRHVGSKDNPADVLSRGLTAKTLTSCTLWFQGPIFLHGKQELWPPQFSAQLHIPTELEKKKEQAISMVTVPSSNDFISNPPLPLGTAPISNDFISNIPNKNSFKYLQKTVAYVLRFINHTKCPREARSPQISLTPQELDDALITIIVSIQAVNFKEEIKQLKTKKLLSRSHPLNSLSPFLDNKGIMRVGGRLEASCLSYDAKHPMLVPYNGPLTKLILVMTHEENLHCGPQALLAISRQRFWIIKGKILAKTTVHGCVRCTRAKPRLLNQLMGNLPATRVTPARPFINTGVDFCGPFWVHYRIRGKRPTKAYIAVFCCFATKAVHLELVTDLTTEAFIGSIRRFICRRGHIKKLYCDNATNFVGAKNQLTELRETIQAAGSAMKITNVCNTKGIEFHFIPPRAPHFGGLWEAAVKAAKQLLIRSVSASSLTQEELGTVITEIEAILNSRPITPMSDDPNDLSALTPGHFLIGEPLTAQVDSRAIAPNSTLSARWKAIAQIKQEFWQRWCHEYLSELQQRHKWKTPSANIQIGDMVIVKEDNLPVMKWPLGRIVNVYKGDDNLIRVVDVKTASGVFKRAIHRLALLPIKIEEHQELAKNSCQGVQSDELVPSRQEGAQPDEIMPSRQETKTTECQTKRQSSSQLRAKDNTEGYAKKSRIALQYSPATILVILLMLPLELCSPIIVTKFDPAVGLHFEHIGSSQITASEWTLVIYYDLTPLVTEIQLLINGTNAMQHICQQLQQKSWCEELVTQFRHTNTEVALDNSLLAPHRQRRGAINVVGNLANSLFGVLDSEYASKMSETITAVENNEQHLVQLAKEQTSIIDTTINVIKRNQITAQETFAKVETKISEVINRIHVDERDAHNERMFQVFLSLAIQLTTTAANIQRVQSAIINVLINVHHGQISPQLLSPQQLHNELAKITAHLPPTRQIPGYHGNLLSIYKIMTVKGGITKKHAIFKITVPLTGPDQFELYRLIPIPIWLNNTMMAIKPTTPLLAITLHRDKYFPVNMEVLQSCTKLEEESYLCPNSQPIYNKGATTCACEVQLFNNETSTQCKVGQVDDHVWIQTNQRNKWIFALSSPIQMTAVCNDQVSQIPLEGSGFLQLAPECVIKYNHLTLMANQLLYSDLKASYTSFGQLPQLKGPDPPQSLSPTSTDDQYTTRLQELTTLQRRLQAYKVNDLPNEISHHDIHHYTAIYSCAAILICIIAWMIWRHIQGRQQITLLPRHAPIPLPRNRQQCTVDDSIMAAHESTLL